MAPSFEDTPRARLLRPEGSELEVLTTRISLAAFWKGSVYSVEQKAADDLEGRMNPLARLNLSSGILERISFH